MWKITDYPLLEINLKVDETSKKQREKKKKEKKTDKGKETE